jgi:hypothetical protein
MAKSTNNPVPADGNKGYVPSSPPPTTKPSTSLPAKHGYQPSSPPPQPPKPAPKK